MNHISRCYLCPDCNYVGDNAIQCESCANRCGLLNLSSVLNRKSPLLPETMAILEIINCSMRELI